MSDQLTWGHFVELLSIDHDLERSFYEKQCVLERWTVRELKRQKESLRAQLEAILGEPK